MDQWYIGVTGCVCHCSVTNVNLYTMPSRSVMATPHIAIRVNLVSATDMPPAVSTTRLWIQNRRDTTSAEAASVSTAAIIQQEADATHAQRATSGRQDAVCLLATCVSLVTAVQTAL